MEPLDLNKLCRKFLIIFQKFFNNNYFRYDFGVGPDEDEFSSEKGKIGYDLEKSMKIELDIEIPNEKNISNLTEKQLFDSILFLYEHIAKPEWKDEVTDTNYYYKAFTGDYKKGKEEFQKEINKLLKNYKEGFNLDSIKGIIHLNEGKKSPSEIQDALDKINQIPKKYQIFISSTIEDLKDERREIVQRILEMGHIPCGMELFPASNEDSWNLIQKTIRDCDYYILVSAGKYGSENKEEISYTELEYRYALDIGIPVMAFLFDKPDEIVRKKTDKTDIGWTKLQEFRKFIQSQRNVRFWRDIGELATSLAIDLPKLILDNPREGWIKTNYLTKVITGKKEEENSLKLAELINENATLKNQIGNLKNEIEVFRSSSLDKNEKSKDNQFTRKETEKLESNLRLICTKLKLILEDAATYGNFITQNEKMYTYLRKILFSLSDVSLPSFLPICANLKEIFKLLQNSSSTYKGRRTIINSEIDNFIKQIDNNSFSVSDAEQIPYENLKRLWQSDNILADIEAFIEK